MIRDSIIQYTLDNKIFMVLSMLFIMVFSIFTYETYKREIKLYNFVENVHAVEINLFELTTFTKRMLLDIDNNMWKRIAQSKEKLNRHLLLLKTSNKKYQKEFMILQLEIQNLFETIDKLIKIKQHKKQ